MLITLITLLPQIALYEASPLVRVYSKAPLDTTSATIRSINEEASNGIVRSREFRLRSSRAGGSSGTLHGAHVLLQQEVTSPEIVSRSNVTWSCRKLRLEEERGREGRERRNRTDGRGVIEDYFVLVLNHLSKRKKRRVSAPSVINTYL